MKILLAADGSEYTQRMLEYLAAHQDLVDSAHEYTVLTVVPAVPPRVTGFIDRASLDDYYREQAQAVLDPIKQRIDELHWNATLMHKVGHAPDMIAATATEGSFDLLMMGSHGHRPVASLVLGSVTSRVLANCKTPLLIVR